MKVILKTPLTLERLVSKALGSRPWPFDEVEVRLGHSNEAKFADGRVHIQLDSCDPCLSSPETSTGLVLHLLYLAELYAKGEASGIEVIDLVRAGRNLVVAGHQNEYFASSWAKLSAKPSAKGLEDFLRLNVPWLAFYDSDKYNAQVLRELAMQSDSENWFGQKAYKFVSVMKGDLRQDKTITAAQEAYRRMRGE